MMNRLIIIAATVLALTGCTQKRFDHVENTPVSRYDIVYDDGMCGITALYLFCEEQWRTRLQSLCSVAARMGWMEWRHL